MNEPFLPLPLPGPPEDGIGPAFAGALGAVSRSARRFVRWFRRIDLRDPLVRGDFPKPDPRLAAPARSRARAGKRGVRFPVVPPVEL